MKVTEYDFYSDIKDLDRDISLELLYANYEAQSERFYIIEKSNTFLQIALNSLKLMVCIAVLCTLDQIQINKVNHVKYFVVFQHLLDLGS